MAQYGKVNYDFQCELSQNFRKMLYEGKYNISSFNKIERLVLKLTVYSDA